MADYALTATPDTIIRTTDGAFIPNEERNADYRAYLDWIAAGNTPDPYVPPDSPPPIDDPVQDVVLFDHENRLRVLEGQPPLTLQEFKSKLHDPPPPSKPKKRK